MRWWAYEYPLKKRNPDWFWVLGILSVALIVAAILLRNFLFAVLTILGALLLALFSIRKPQIITFEINSKGLVVHRKLYLFKDLDAFWITPEGSPRLLVQSKRTFVPLISIPLENVDTARVHALLQGKLEERELEDSLAVQFLERLGF